MTATSRAWTSSSLPVGNLRMAKSRRCIVLVLTVARPLVFVVGMAMSMAVGVIWLVLQLRRGRGLGKTQDR